MKRTKMTREMKEKIAKGLVNPEEIKVTSKPKEVKVVKEKLVFSTPKPETKPATDTNKKPYNKNGKKYDSKDKGQYKKNTGNKYDKKSPNKNEKDNKGKKPYNKDYKGNNKNNKNFKGKGNNNPNNKGNKPAPKPKFKKKEKVIVKYQEVKPIVNNDLFKALEEAKKNDTSIKFVEWFVFDDRSIKKIYDQLTNIKTDLKLSIYCENLLDDSLPIKREKEFDMEIKITLIDAELLSPLYEKFNVVEKEETNKKTKVVDCLILDELRYYHDTQIVFLKKYIEQYNPKAILKREEENIKLTTYSISQHDQNLYESKLNQLRNAISKNIFFSLKNNQRITLIYENARKKNVRFFVDKRKLIFNPFGSSTSPVTDSVRNILLINFTEDNIAFEIKAGSYTFKIVDEENDTETMKLWALGYVKVSDYNKNCYLNPDDPFKSDSLIENYMNQFTNLRSRICKVAPFMLNNVFLSLLSHDLLANARFLNNGKDIDTSKMKMNTIINPEIPGENVIESLLETLNKNDISANDDLLTLFPLFKKTRGKWTVDAKAILALQNGKYPGIKEEKTYIKSLQIANR